MKLNVLDWVALVLVIIGAVNWGVQSVFSNDLVTPLLGSYSNIVYGIVGLAGIYMIYVAVKLTKADRAQVPASNIM